MCWRWCGGSGSDSDPQRPLERPCLRARFLSLLNRSSLARLGCASSIASSSLPSSPMC
jgi:hypothetical protein